MDWGRHGKSIDSDIWSTQGGGGQQVRRQITDNPNDGQGGALGVTRHRVGEGGSKRKSSLGKGGE